jgi:DNA-binding winged helix-turn-helix (wHTH) protein/tetratricopeptide (TPR) repeat protein
VAQHEDELILGACRIDLDRLRIDRPGVTDELTPLEGRFLRRLAASPGRVVAQRDLLRDVWQYHESVHSRAVTLLVSRLRQKIEADPANPVLLRTVRGVGFVLEFPDDGGSVVDARERDVQAWDRDGDAAAAERLRASIPALEALAAGPPTREGVRARCALSAARRVLNRPTPTVELWDGVDELVPAAWRLALACEAARGLQLGGNGRAALDVLAPHLHSFPWSIADADLYVDAHVLATECALRAVDGAEAERHARLAVQGAERAGDPLLVSMALSQAAVAAWHTGELVRADRLFSEARPLMVARRGARLLAEHDANHATLWIEMARLTEAEQALARVVPWFEANAAPELTQARTNLASVWYQLGRFADAEHLLLTVLADGNADRRARGNALVRLATIHMERGSFESARAVLDEAQYLGERAQLPRVAAFATAYLGLIALIEGATAEADARLADAILRAGVDRAPWSVAFFQAWRGLAIYRLGGDAAPWMARAEAGWAGTPLAGGWPWRQAEPPAGPWSGHVRLSQLVVGRVTGGVGDRRAGRRPAG